MKYFVDSNLEKLECISMETALNMNCDLENTVLWYQILTHPDGNNFALVIPDEDVEVVGAEVELVDEEAMRLNGFFLRSDQ